MDRSESQIAEEVSTLKATVSSQVEHLRSKLIPYIEQSRLSVNDCESVTAPFSRLHDEEKWLRLREERSKLQLRLRNAKLRIKSIREEIKQRAANLQSLVSAAEQRPVGVSIAPLAQGPADSNQTADALQATFDHFGTR